jgi:hypothetical protein
MRVAVVVAFLLSLPFLVACEREKRDLRLDPPALEALDAIATMPDGISGAPSDVYVAMNRTYEANAYQLSQGKRLYEWFNCTGCHANGRRARPGCSRRLVALRAGPGLDLRIHSGWPPARHAIVS